MAAANFRFNILLTVILFSFSSCANSQSASETGMTIEEKKAYYRTLEVKVVEGKQGLFTKQGEEIIPPLYDIVNARPDLVVEVQEGRMRGLLNLKNEWIIPMENYVLQRRTSRHYAVSPVNVDNGGILDVNGNVVMEHGKYSKFHFNKKAKFIYAQLARGGKFGIYDFDGKEIVAPKYKKLTQSTSGYTYATNFENRMGLIDMEAKEISEFGFDDIRIDEEGDDWIFKGYNGDAHEIIHRTKKVDYRKKSRK